MAVSTIDGTVEEAVLLRSRRGLNLYDRVVFRLVDGTTKTWAKAVVDESIVPYLQPGSSGRFYLYNTIDHRGVHGVRAADGAAVYHFSPQYEKFALVIALLNLAAFVVMLALGKLMGLALILLLLAGPMYLHYRNVRVETKAQFDRDAAPGPAAVATAS